MSNTAFNTNPQVRDYLAQLESHLGEAARQAGRLVAKETELTDALLEFGQVRKALLQALCAAFPSLCCIIMACMACCILCCIVMAVLLWHEVKIIQGAGPSTHPPKAHRRLPPRRLLRSWAAWRRATWRRPSSSWRQRCV